MSEPLMTIFQFLGLSDKQVKLYQALLKVKQARAARLSAISGVARSNVYVLTEELVKLGLVEVIGKGKVMAFRAANPDVLTELVTKKEAELRIVRDLAKTAVPGLKHEWKTTIGKPTIKVYEGAEGLREVFADIYAPKAEAVVGAVDAEKIDTFISNMSYGELVPSRIKNKLFVKCIYNDNDLGKKLKANEKVEFREAVLFDQNKYPLPAEIEAYDNKVAMMSFNKQDFIGLIIENEDFATTLKSIFNFLFDKMRENKI